MTQYRGPRTQKAIQGFVKRREVPVVTQIEGAMMGQFNRVDDVVVVAYLSKDDATLLEGFRTVARELHRDYVFGHTDDASLAAAENLSVPSIKVFKNADNDHRTLSGTFTSTSLASFLDTAVPTVIRDFSEKQIDTFMQRDKLTVYIFTATDSQATSLRQNLTPLAKKYEKYVVGAIADVSRHGEMATNFLVRFGVEETEMKTPCVVVHAPLNDNVFLYEPGKKIEVVVLEGMLMGILQGKAKSGDVFGKEAADMEGEEGQEGGHDEL